MSNKPSIPKGTRDFSPTEMARRNYIFDTIKKVYKRYGFQQIETPAMENLNTLIGTGGDESDKLIFKILDSGAYAYDQLKDKLNEIDIEKSVNSEEEIDEEILREVEAPSFTKEFASKALRYDLTVPFARFVTQNQNDIIFPFRRFQIQPVWRADKPQKGRYREFYQCDADIIGSDSLLNEVDLIKIIDDVFSELFQGKLDYTVTINNRKILQGIVESVGEQDQFEGIVVAIDKFDKIGIDGVISELFNLGLDEKSGKKLLELIGVKDVSNKMDGIPLDRFKFIKLQLEFIEKSIKNTINGQKGIGELEFVFEKLKALKVKNIKFDPTLARGLGYYTGTIIEVKVANFPSICGGGRYDDLTGKFGLKDVSGVGISFGADRIYDVLLDEGLYPESIETSSTQVLFTNQSDNDEEKFLPILFELRGAGISSEIYPDQVKWKRQMNFVTRKNIKFVVSSNQDGELFVKNIETDEKTAFSSTKELVSLINK